MARCKDESRGLRLGEQYCTAIGCWNPVPEALCKHCQPKPPAKRKAKFKRWTVHEDGDYCWPAYQPDGGRKRRVTVDAVVDLLNAARITLPTGRKAKP